MREGRQKGRKEDRKVGTGEINKEKGREEKMKRKRKRGNRGRKGKEEKGEKERKKKGASEQ